MKKISGQLQIFFINNLSLFRCCYCWLATHPAYLRYLATYLDVIKTKSERTIIFPIPSLVPYYHYSFLRSIKRTSSDLSLTFPPPPRTDQSLILFEPFFLPPSLRSPPSLLPLSESLLISVRFKKDSPPPPSHLYFSFVAAAVALVVRPSVRPRRHAPSPSSSVEIEECLSQTGLWKKKKKESLSSSSSFAPLPPPSLALSLGLIITKERQRETQRRNRRECDSPKTLRGKWYYY